MMKKHKTVFLLAGLATLLIASCGSRWNRDTGPRFPITCQGTPSVSDYHLTEKGDLLINGEKCKFFRTQGKPGKRKKS